MAEPEPILDCCDSSCLFAEQRGGMRTNGGCCCLESLDDDPGRRLHVVAAIKKLIADRAALRKLLASWRPCERAHESPPGAFGEESEEVFAKARKALLGPKVPRR